MHPCLSICSQRAKVNCGSLMFRSQQRNSKVIVTQDLTHPQPGKSTLMTTFVVSCSQLLKYSQRYSQTRRSNRTLLSSRQRIGRSHEERDNSGFLGRAAQGTESSHEIQRMATKATAQRTVKASYRAPRGNLRIP